MTEQELTDPVADEVTPVEEGVVPPVEEDEHQLAFDVHAFPGGIRGALEAVLMVVDEPIPAPALASALEVPTQDVEAELAAMEEAYAAEHHGFTVRRVGEGWRYYSRVDYAPVVEKFLLDGQQARLTQAALETLAVIAYRQPVSRSRVSAVRGVNVDGVIRTLLTRGLIAEAGHDGESGAHLYTTTSYFLERMGIASLDDLPPLAEHLPDLADLEDVLDSVATGD